MSGFDTEDFWITSDLHLGHPLLTQLRGFASTSEHDTTILGGLYGIPDNSTLVCLGDISVGKDEYALGRLRELKLAKGLTMILTPGNHDTCHPKFGLKKMLTWTPKYEQVFDFIAVDFMLRRRVLFTHLPRLEDPHRSAKLSRWIARDGFECVVHGHTHSSKPLAPGHVNVCLEATDLKPIHASELWRRVTQVQL